MILPAIGLLVYGFIAGIVSQAMGRDYRVPFVLSWFWPVWPLMWIVAWLVGKPSSDECATCSKRIPGRWRWMHNVSAVLHFWRSPRCRRGLTMRQWLARLALFSVGLGNHAPPIPPRPKAIIAHRTVDP